jgi:hypothetical protein
MPRVAKIIENEPEHSEVGIMGLTSRSGKTTWILIRQNVTESGVVKDYVDLMEDDTDKEGNNLGTVSRVTFKSKANALAFQRGYNYALSEAAEAE